MKNLDTDYLFCFRVCDNRLNLARLINNGKLPPRSKEAMLIFGAIFIVLAGVKLVASKSGNSRFIYWSKFIPSG